ncbi:hypothetical protein O6H91_Y571700 [Diphasiastrum complanatum]|nr:hypothetical protein O6H91_Y571700 [Diphasiastrum complanatum]
MEAFEERGIAHDHATTGGGDYHTGAELHSHNVADTWHDFNLQNWRDCQSQAFDARMKTPPGLRILGNDNHEGALSLCVRNAKTAGICHLLELSCQDCSLYIPPIAPSLVVVNPPWGSRLGDDSAHDSEWIACTWTALGKFLKRSCTRADVYVLSGNANATQDLQLKSDKKWHLTVGGVDCKLLHYYVLPPKQKEADI